HPQGDRQPHALPVHRSSRCRARPAGSGCRRSRHRRSLGSKIRHSPTREPDSPQPSELTPPEGKRTAICNRTGSSARLTAAQNTNNGPRVIGGTRGGVISAGHAPLPTVAARDRARRLALLTRRQASVMLPGCGRAHEIASTLTAHHLAAARPPGTTRCLVSVLVSFTPV